MNKIDLIIDALDDMLSGWKYIRESHGDLYGVGWYRAESKAVEALAAARSLRELEPVARVYKDNTVTTDPDRADGTWTKLYALGDEK